MVRIHTLIENDKSLDKDKEGLVNEFGLSLLIEDGRKSFLFDTGKTGEFINNAKKMKLDLSKITHMVLSHSHYDHTGGVKTFIKEFGGDFTLHVNKSFFEEKYKILENGEYKFLGNDFDAIYLLENGVHLHSIYSDTYKVSTHVTLHTNFEKMNDFEELMPYYVRKIGEDYEVDEMNDESALVVEKYNGVYIIVGCSHIGIANIIENIKSRINKKILGVIGGLHLSRADNDRMEKVIDYFLENNIKYFAVSHCTGSNFLNKMNEKIQDEKIVYNHTGDTIEL